MTDLNALLAQIDTVLADCDAHQLPPLPKLTPEQLAEIPVATVEKATTPHQPAPAEHDQAQRKVRPRRHRMERIKPWWSRRK